MHVVLILGLAELWRLDRSAFFICGATIMVVIAVC